MSCLMSDNEQNNNSANADDKPVEKRYQVACVPASFKEWQKLNHSIRLQFEKKLQKLVINPHIERNRLSGALSNCYKIKLKRAGYRLIYQVREDWIVLLIWAVGKREDSEAYDTAQSRLSEIANTSELTEIDV